MGRILHEASGDNFGVKANMLGIDVDKQVEYLNKMYDGRAKFSAEPNTLYNTWGIVVQNIEHGYSQFILPDTDAYCIESLIWEYGLNGLESVVIPKSVKELDLSRCNWANYIKRIFCYDTTHVKLDTYEVENNSLLQMIIVKPLEKLDRPMVYYIK